MQNYLTCTEYSMTIPYFTSYFRDANCLQAGYSCDQLSGSRAHDNVTSVITFNATLPQKYHLFVTVFMVLRITWCRDIIRHHQFCSYNSCIYRTVKGKKKMKERKTRGSKDDCDNSIIQSYTIIAPKLHHKFIKKMNKHLYNLP